MLDPRTDIVALRNEKGSYNHDLTLTLCHYIVALRNEKGSYNYIHRIEWNNKIVALQNKIETS